MKILSNKGVMVDLAQFSDTTIAAGNAKMNARGDILGAGGAVVKSREQVQNDYYRDNPRAVTSYASIHSIEDEVLSAEDAVKLLSGAQEVQAAPEIPAPKSRKRQATETED